MSQSKVHFGNTYEVGCFVVSFILISIAWKLCVLVRLPSKIVWCTTIKFPELGQTFYMAAVDLPLGGSARVDGEKVNIIWTIWSISNLKKKKEWWNRGASLKFLILISNQKFVVRVIMQFSSVLNVSYDWLSLFLTLKMVSSLCATKYISLCEVCSCIINSLKESVRQSCVLSVDPLLHLAHVAHRITKFSET